MERFIVTISREYGSGGRLVGKDVAKELGVPFYDREMIALTAEKSGFSPAVIADEERKKTRSFLYGLYTTSQGLPISDQIFIAQCQVVQDLAKQGPAVIVGRCGDYVLRNHENCLRVFIHAPLEQRIARAQEEYGVINDDLPGLVKKEDKKRSAYYSHFTQQRWGEAKNYHLCVDSSLGLAAVTGMIIEIAKGVK